MAQNVSVVATRDRLYACPIGVTYIDVAAFGTPSTVTLIPGGGGTAALAYSTTPHAAGAGAAATWLDWPSGTVAAATSNTLASPVSGFRVTATTAAASLEIVG